MQNESVGKLANEGLEISNRIKELTNSIDELLKQINELSSERTGLIFKKGHIVDELVRRKMHDIGGALSAIQRGQIAYDSIEILNLERKPVVVN
jgi:uncharacterized coiled-coil DUF342 family protein